MNTALWIIQGILAVKMITAAGSHAFQPDLETMQAAVQRLGPPAGPLLYLSAVLSLLSGGALLVPALKPSWGMYLPAAAAFLGLVLVISLVFHLIARDQPRVYVTLILLALTACLAYGRWTLAPL
jgi:hypothetical protein